MTVGEYMMDVLKLDEEIEDIERTLEDTGVPVGALNVPSAIKARFTVRLLNAELAQKRRERTFLCGLKVEPFQKEKSPE